MTANGLGIYEGREIEALSPALRLYLTVACYFKETHSAMTNHEILQAVRRVEGLEEMTVNERLYVSGLMNEFDKSKKHDKVKAAYILELLKVDKPSIYKILN